MPPCDNARSSKQRIADAIPYVGSHGLRTVAKHFNVSSSSLSDARNRVQKGLPMYPPVGRPRVLNDDVEAAIVQFFVDCAAANLPMPTQNLKEIAISVAQGMGISGFEAGKEWRRGFMARHGDQLEARTPRPFPTQRNTEQPPYQHG